MADNEDIVTFQNSLGETISNDPRWHARQTLSRQEGVDVDALQAELEELRAFKAANLPNQPGAVGSVVTSGNDEEDDETDGEGPYDSVKGAELGNLAKERGIKLTHEDGSKLKAGEVRAALVAQDEAGQ